MKNPVAVLYVTDDKWTGHKIDFKALENYTDDEISTLFMQINIMTTEIEVFLNIRQIGGVRHEDID